MHESERNYQKGYTIVPKEGTLGPPGLRGGPLYFFEGGRSDWN